MTKEYKTLLGSYKSIEKKIPYKPEIAITLGTGLGDFVENLQIDAAFDFDKIKNFPKTTNKHHKGRFIFTKINGVKVLVMQGRLHFYEGYFARVAVRPVRLAKMLGARALIVTNASGGINKKFKQGDIMLIKDHISFYMLNPLYGENVKEFGTRFPDMTEAYNKDLQKLLKASAKKSNISLKEGIYVQLPGPSFETPAEIKLLGFEGADSVGMSTVIEVIAARHAGMKVAGLSCITNLAAGLSKDIQTDEEVRTNASKMTIKLYKILDNFINKKLLKVI